MSNEYVLSPESLRSYNSWHRNIGLLLLLALLVLPWLFNIGPNSWQSCMGVMQSAAPAAAPAPAPAPAVTPEPAAPAAVAAPAPPIVDAVPAANVYFELDKTVAPQDVDQTLAKVVDYLKTHASAQAVLSGFHDPRGNRAYNEELALNRARAVRTALGRAGIPEDRVVMQKPQETVGTGSNEEARRVEVTIKP